MNIKNAKLQAALNFYGAMPQLDVDGVIGVKTRFAIIAFQKNCGLSQTGYFDDELFKYIASRGYSNSDWLPSFLKSSNIEGLYLKAYLCPAKVWTIGIGTTRYPNGQRVKSGDTCTYKEAVDYLNNDLKLTRHYLNSALSKTLLFPCQYDALISIAYNIGTTALHNSSLLRKVIANAEDESIRHEFTKWVYGGNGSNNGKDDDGDGLIDEPGEKQKLDGLVNRRNHEADRYFSFLV